LWRKNGAFAFPQKFFCQSRSSVLHSVFSFQNERDMPVPLGVPLLLFSRNRITLAFFPFPLSNGSPPLGSGVAPPPSSLHSPEVLLVGLPSFFCRRFLQIAGNVTSPFFFGAFVRRHPFFFFPPLQTEPFCCFYLEVCSSLFFSLPTPQTTSLLPR